MGLKDPAKERAYQKEYYAKNKEAILERKKEYYENNKEKIYANHKEYYEKHKEKLNANHKEYNQTEVGKKSCRISNWKKRGIESEDFESLYNFYINSKNCEKCNVELTEDKVRTKTTRCLDHDHDTGLFRNVLCNLCNIKRG